MDPRDPDREVAAVLGTGECPLTQAAAIAGAFVCCQLSLARGDIPQRPQRSVPDLGRELVRKAAGRSERHDEPQAGILDLRQRLGMPAGRIAHQHTSRTGHLREALEAASDERQLGRVARVRPPVHRHPVRRGGLQRPDLPAYLPIRPPPLRDQRRLLIGARDPQRRQIDMQPSDIQPEPVDRARGKRAANRLRVHREGLKRPPEPVIVQQSCGDPEQLVHRRPRRPPGHVIQRRGRAQPRADQSGNDLPDRQHRPRTAGQRAVHNGDEIKRPHEVPGQQQRADLPARAGHRRIQPRERSRQRL